MTLPPRDFTPVANVVEANLLAVDASGTAGKVFNVTCGKRYNLLELIEVLNRILDTSPMPIYAINNRCNFGRIDKSLDHRGKK